MRVLIVGAGIAGLTLGALLRQKGLKPLLVDRAPDFSVSGYMLGLFPMGNRVLHGLGAFDAFLAKSEPMDIYTMCNGHGEAMQTFDIAAALGKFGVTRQLSRADLLQLLRDCAPDVPLRMGTPVTGLVEQGAEVEAFAGKESLGRFDLVVGADGIHSTVRRHIDGDVEMRPTGWGGWVWWAPASAAPHKTVTEYWGAGRFVGVYPIRDRIGVIAGRPRSTRSATTGSAAAAPGSPSCSPPTRALRAHPSTPCRPTTGTCSSGTSKTAARRTGPRAAWC